MTASVQSFMASFQEIESLTKDVEAVLGRGSSFNWDKESLEALKIINPTLGDMAEQAIQRLFIELTSFMPLLIERGIQNLKDHEGDNLVTLPHDLYEHIHGIIKESGIYPDIMAMPSFKELFLEKE